MGGDPVHVTRQLASIRRMASKLAHHNVPTNSNTDPPTGTSKCLAAQSRRVSTHVRMAAKMARDKDEYITRSNNHITYLPIPPFKLPL